MGFFVGVVDGALFGDSVGVLEGDVVGAELGVLVGENEIQQVVLQLAAMTLLVHSP